MSASFGSLVPLLAALSIAGGAPGPSPSPSAPASQGMSPVVPPPSPGTDLETPLDAGERDTILRLAWQTVVGHLTDHPIQDRDLDRYDLTPRLTAPRGCFVTLRKLGQIRGNQGEVDATRPLYQQVIVFTRRAATRDPRFLPLTDRDIPDLTIEITVIGRRDRVEGPAAIEVNRHGVFLEKWGRRALLLPGQIAREGWTTERALDELCRQAALPAGAWKQGANLQVFVADVIAGPQPPPPSPPAALPTSTPGGAASEPGEKPRGGARRKAARFPT